MLCPYLVTKVPLDFDYHFHRVLSFQLFRLGYLLQVSFPKLWHFQDECTVPIRQLPSFLLRRRLFPVFLLLLFFPQHLFIFLLLGLLFLGLVEFHIGVLAKTLELG